MGFLSKDQTYKGLTKVVHPAKADVQADLNLIKWNIRRAGGEPEVKIFEHAGVKNTWIIDVKLCDHQVVVTENYDPGKSMTVNTPVDEEGKGFWRPMDDVVVGTVHHGLWVREKTRYNG